MEAFSLLKYWRASAGGGGGGAIADLAPLNNTPKPVNAADSTTAENDNNNTNTNSSNDDDGPFFDLEFSLDDDEELEDMENDSDIDIDDDDDDDDESKSTTKSESENDNEEEREFSLVPIESPNDNNNKAQFPVSSLIKSATRFRVFMSGFNKRTSAKPNTSSNDNGESVTTSGVNTNSSSKKLFTVKFKVEEVPIVSLFTRDSSARGSGRVKQVQQQGGGSEAAAAAAEEKRFSKEAVKRYLRKVRPLYVRVSRRSGVDAGAKSKVVMAAAVDEAAVVKVGGMNLPAGLRVVCKHLGKSRSASSMVVVPAGNAEAVAAAGRRRDDSLIQQQDGIQSAILHCKRSFNSPRGDSEACLLSRCTSDPSNNEKKGLDLSRKSADGIQRP